MLYVTAIILQLYTLRVYQGDHVNVTNAIITTLCVSKNFLLLSKACLHAPLIKLDMDHR